MDVVITRVRKVVTSAINLAKDSAELITIETREAARTGFGLPRAITSISSLGCFVVLAAGTTNIAVDAFKKVYGPKECDGCGGWESVCCQMCRGTGKVQYGIISEGSSSSDSSNEMLLPIYCNTAGSLPIKDCPNCSGTGVMKCIVCKGNATKKCISLANVLDAPWKSYEAYRRSKSASLPKNAMKNNLDVASYWLFDRNEIINGEKLPDEEKDKILWNYLYSQQYNIARRKVLAKEPGWEEMQKKMISLDPMTAIADPAIIHNFERFHIEQKAKSEVFSKKVPPRPANWVLDEKMFEIKIENDFEKEMIEKKKKRIESNLDIAWRNHWQQNQIAQRITELEAFRIKEKEIEKEIVDKEAEPLKPVHTQSDTKKSGAMARDKVKPSESAATGPSGGVPAGEKKKDPKKLSAAEKKKKELEEKREKYAKQAAEREAYLAKLKQQKKQQG